MNFIPYNVRELFLDHPLLAPIGLLLGVIALSTLPWTLAMLWSTARQREFAKSLAIAVGSLLFAFIVVRSSVPTESIDDIVGTPALGIGGDLERCLRFIALMLGVVASQALGILLSRGPQRTRTDSTQGVSRSGAVYITIEVVFLILCSYAVVVVVACTNNITELLSDGGYSWNVLGLPVWLMVTGFSLGRLQLATNTTKRTWVTGYVHALVLLLLTFPVGWVLVNLATESSITKYGETFSALQFLFSRDRSAYIPVDQLPTRFAIAHAMLILQMCFGWLIFRLISKRLWRTSWENDESAT